MDLIDSILPLSAHKALLLTSASHSTWELRLGLAADRDPADSITRLRWRPSCRGGRTWVKPPRLDRDLRSAAARARPAGQANDCSDPQAALMVCFRSPLSSDPDGLLKTMVQQISIRTNLALTEGNPQRALGPGCWAAVRDGAGRWTGAFRVQLRDRTEALNLAVALRSYAVQVGDVIGILDAHSPYLPDWLTATPALARPPSTSTSSTAAAGFTQPAVMAAAQSF